MTSRSSIFLDSDVIISSFLSSKGASFFLIQESTLHFFISDFSKRELHTVGERLNINKETITTFMKEKTSIVRLNTTHEEIKKTYEAYVTDPEDAHIIAGSVKSHAAFLLTYNLKHYKADKIHRDLHILILTPGQYLQYMRTRS